MKTVCEKNKCVGCMECISICPKSAIVVKDELSHYNAYINTDLCVNCSRCHSSCQNNRNIEMNEPIEWYQGWANDVEVRKSSSSGGAASAIERAFIENGGYVCSCFFDTGEFKFKIAKTIEELNGFSGSKYVKSNPLGIYEKALKELQNNKKLLFVGLPCQAEAIRNYCSKYEENLYTIDLICHGTPSPILLNDYLTQIGIDIKKTDDIKFRLKGSFHVDSNAKPTASKGTVDRYSLAFLCSVDYTENCYECKFAGIKRGSDLTLGDSWGSKLSVDEQRKGISLILVQSDKGRELLRLANLNLTDVNLDEARKSNGQLNAPCQKTEKTDTFFKNYVGNFKQRVFKVLTWKCIKQYIKGTLVALKIYGGVTDYTVTVNAKYGVSGDGSR